MIEDVVDSELDAIHGQIAVRQMPSVVGIESPAIAGVGEVEMKPP